ncbi:chromobox protein homolog 2-like [Mytilus trossulus]|uniref:chromobox protein homolog 2-like n=1 Tax=Mytilus trossulus TaxID=6551 RepID=UPI003003D797
MEAEQVLQERSRGRGKKEYLVRWEGKGPESDSWEPASSVPQKIVKRFSSPGKKTPAKRSRTRSTSRGRGGRSRSKTRKASKSPSRRKSAPTAAPTRQSRRSIIETKTPESEIRTETLTSKTDVSQNNIGTVTRTVTEEKTVTSSVKKSPINRFSDSDSAPAWKRNLPDVGQYYNSDYAMIIVFTCVTIITLSFVLENKVDFAAIWEYLKNLFNSLVLMMTSVFPSSPETKSTGSQTGK